MPTRRRSVVWAALLASALFAQGCLMREDELLCEQAAVHLSACCERTVPMRCTYFQNWESASHRPPVLGVDAGRCVTRASCQALRAAGVCEVPSWQLQGTCTAQYAQSSSSELRAACATLEVLSCW